MFYQLVSNFNATYAVADEIFTRLSRFEFDKQERESEVQSIFADFLKLLSHQPFQFTIGGFYATTTTFLASVSDEKAKIIVFLTAKFQIVTGILTYIIILAQFYTPKQK